MGKPSGKKKNIMGGKSRDQKSKRTKPGDIKSKAFDEDTTIFINMSQEMKEEGNKLFQKRDHEGAMLKYEKALKLLPRDHIDVSYLRTNMAACFMEMGPGEYHKAINECNLALEVSPKYSKALLKRARCYETLNRLDWAFRDATLILSSEPNNIMALEISERVKATLAIKGIKVDAKEVLLAQEYVEPVTIPRRFKAGKEKKTKKSNSISCNKTEDKAVVEEKPAVKQEPSRTMKLVFGEDIRCVQVPANCSILHMREMVGNKFPRLEAFLIKYKDEEGDLVTITTTEELRWAEASGNPQASVKLFVTEVNPSEDPLFEEARKLEMNHSNPSEDGASKQGFQNVSTCIEDWIVRFASLFKNYVGFNSNAYLDLHELGMKLYSEAMEDIATSEEAQELFEIAADKFQEMSALALFNWGNVHMSRARKRLSLPEDSSRESILSQVNTAYQWAQKEYAEAAERYREALKLKPDFYEGHLALGQQQFELARLSWYYAIGTNVDLQSWPYKEVIELFDHAETNILSGAHMLEEMGTHHLVELLKADEEKEKIVLQKMAFDGLLEDASTDLAAEHLANLKSQTNLLWGSLLYERSVIEFKLGHEFWEDCLEAATEKFEDAGASPVDVAVLRKNHCSNATAQEGLVFKVDEIVQAWNDMYDAKRWLNGVSSFRLEPLFRSRTPKLHQILENVF